MEMGGYQLVFSGIQTTYSKGRGMCYAADRTIYAHQAKYRGAPTVPVKWYSITSPKAARLTDNLFT